MASTPGNGAVRPEDYATAEYLELLSPVVSRAQEDLPGYPLDEQELGRSIALLLQFMERELGKDAAAGGKRVPKLPVKPLRDFSSDGPLLSLVGAFESFQRDRDWEADDFSSEDAYPKSQCLELIQQVRSVWEAKGFVASPRVFVDPSCGEDYGRLQVIVAALGGAVAASADDQGITHLVLPDDNPPVGAELAPRTLEVRGSQAHVHWQRLPDSYDTWVAAQAAPEPSPEPLPEPTKPWRVYPQYLFDSHQYNEWMNPSDYALKDARGTKRGREEAPEEQEEVPEVTPGAGTELTEGVVKQVVGAPHIYAMDGLARALNLGGGHQGTPLGSSSLRRPPPPSEAEVHRVPAHASWFRWNRINDIERRANPEFFNGRSARKTPRAYKDMRDCIINLFRNDPSRRLTFTECRSKIAADVTSVLRLWGFLDHWGIINFLPDNTSSSAPSSSDPQQQQQHPRVEPGGLPGGSRILLTPPATQNLFAMNQVSSADAAKAAATGSAGPTVLPPSRWRQGPGGPLPGQQQQQGQGQGQEEAAAAEAAAQFLCNADPTHLCGPVRFHCTVTPDVDICGRCFADGRIPVGMARKDFVRIDSRSDQGDEGADWTEQETLMLLEALEIHGENWADVAEHVGTRSQVQCITHFLQLPIEDQFIDPLEAPQQRRLHAVPDQAGPQQQQQEPFGGDVLPVFAGAGNPVMTQLTVLAAIAGPRVAAAAAKAALETLSEVEDLPADEKEGQEGGEASAAATPMETDGEAAASGGADREGGEGQQAAAGGGALSGKALQAAAATGLAAAAVKAKLLADQEERELQRLVVGVIQNQTEKLELKARLYDDLEAAMERERIKLEEGWRALLAERAQFMSEKLAANNPGGAEASGAGEDAAPDDDDDAAAAASVAPAGPPAAAASAAAAAPQGAPESQAPAAVAAAAPIQQQQQQP